MNLILLAGPPGTFDDPHGLLSGSVVTGRHLQVTSLESSPCAAGCASQRPSR